MNYDLGLDGGGTKTAAVVLADGEERGRGQGGSCNIATGTPDSLRESVRAAAASAREAAGMPPEASFRAICAGVAGYTAKRQRAEFTRMLTALFPGSRVRVEPDFVIAYWGATEGEPGVIVSAGTGTAIYGRGATGETCRVDGRGFLLGDRGSGFDIGRTALKRVLRKVDADEALGDFERRVLAVIGAEDADDLIEWVYRDFQPIRIASLARVVGEMAQETEGEAAETAQAILRAAALRLRTGVCRVFRRLALPPETSVHLLGGLWNSTSLLREQVQNGRRDGQNDIVYRLTEPRHDAAYGAALLAGRTPDQSARNGSPLGRMR